MNIFFAYYNEYSKKQYLSKSGFKMSEEKFFLGSKALMTEEVISHFSLPENITVEEALRTFILYEVVLEKFKKTAFEKYSEEKEINDLKKELSKITNLEEILVSKSFEDIILIFFLPWVILSRYHSFLDILEEMYFPEEEKKEKKEAEQEKNVLVFLEDTKGKKIVIRKKEQAFKFVEHSKVGDKIIINGIKFIVKRIERIPEVVKAYNIIIATIKDNSKMEEILKYVSSVKDAHATKINLTNNYSNVVEKSIEEHVCFENSTNENNNNLLDVVANMTGNLFFYTGNDKETVYILKSIEYRNPEYSSNKTEEERKKHIVQKIRSLSSKITTINLKTISKRLNKKYKKILKELEKNKKE